MKPEEAVDLLAAHPKAWASAGSKNGTETVIVRLRNGETRECRTADELREALEEGEKQ